MNEETKVIASRSVFSVVEKTLTDGSKVYDVMATEAWGAGDAVTIELYNAMSASDAIGRMNGLAVVLEAPINSRKQYAAF